jgi:hypothetical protein
MLRSTQQAAIATPAKPKHAALHGMNVARSGRFQFRLALSPRLADRAGLSDAFFSGVHWRYDETRGNFPCH